MTAFEFKNVTIGYTHPVLTNISVRGDANSLISIIGPNGSGKTLFLNALAGLITPISGDIRRPARMAWKSTHLPRFCPFRVTDIVRFHPKAVSGFDAACVSDVLNTFNLTHLSTHPLERLSHGEQHRVFLARLFCANYDMIILDEPLNGLDPIQTIRLNNQLAGFCQRGGIAVVSGHNLDWVAQHSTKIFAAGNGQLIPITNDDLAKEYFVQSWYDRPLSVTTHLQ